MSAEVARVLKKIQRTVESTGGIMQARIYEGLIMFTPVRTGFARSRWAVSVGKEASVSSIAPSNDAAATSLARSGLQVNKSRSKRIRDSYNITQGDIFITNATPYISALNAGSSDRAPAMFVERSIVRGMKLTATDLRRAINSLAS